jgi:hypothetical protein
MKNMESSAGGETPMNIDLRADPQDPIAMPGDSPEKLEAHWDAEMERALEEKAHEELADDRSRERSTAGSFLRQLASFEKMRERRMAELKGFR